MTTADAAERFLGRGRAVRDGILDARAEAAQGAGGDEGHDDEGRRQGQDDDEQRRAEQEQDDDRADEAQRRGQQRRQRLREHRAHLRDVARKAGDELADPSPHVEVKLERDEPLEDLGAEAGDDALADDAKRPGLGERRDRKDEGQAHEDEDELVEVHPRHRH